MAKFIPITLCLLSSFVLISCGGGSSTSEDTLSGLNELDLDYDALKESYGDFSLSDGTNPITVSDGVYYIDVATSKLSYTASGYLDGRIVIRNGDNLSSYKGVTLILNNACIVSSDEIAIEYTLDDKNLELSTTTGTTNYVINTSTTNYDGHAISSTNNLEMVGAGTLNILTAHGHTIKADGDVKLTGSSSIYLSSGHDAIHCHNFTTSNSGSFSGTLTVQNAISQAIEASTNDGDGAVTITKGTFVINNSESAFKVDYLIKISGGSVTGSGITADPFVRGGDSALTLTISDGLTVSFDGVSYSSMTI